MWEQVFYKMSRNFIGGNSYFYALYGVYITVSNG